MSRVTSVGSETANTIVGTNATHKVTIIIIILLQYIHNYFKFPTDEQEFFGKGTSPDPPLFINL